MTINKHTSNKTKKAINCSLGKDSCYLVLLIEKLNKKARDNNLPEPYPYDDCNFVDTTREFNEMFAFKVVFEKYIRENYNPNFKITIHRNNKKDFYKWFNCKFTKGMFKGRPRGYPFFTQKNFCWMRRDFKTSILDRLNLQYDKIYIGIAIDEKERTNRKQYKNLLDKGTFVSFPLIENNITEKQCKDELIKIGQLNPLYELGFTRLGCWDCPFQSVQSLFVLWSNFPDKWSELLENEKISPQGFRLEPLYLYEELFKEDGFVLWDKEFLSNFRKKLKLKMEQRGIQ